MERIRPMEYRDCEDVARLHEAAMGDSLWARLGRRFLVELYRGLVESPHFLAFVYEEREGRRGRVRGFIAGTTEGPRMLGEVSRRRGLILGAAAALGAARRPGVLPLLLETARYFRVSGDAELDGAAESLFCSFEPDLRGRRISGHINKVLFDDFLARGHRLVTITTEADNAAAIRQLASWGFEERGRFRFYGKDMIRYALDLEASPRVEAISRHPAV